VRVLLVGLMATGKSTVARAVAARTGWPELDNDEIVVARTGRTAHDLLAAHGVEALRAAESDVLAVLLATPGPYVAGVPAGTVLDPADRARIASADHVVWLRASVDTLVRRVAAQPDRAWLDQDPRAVLTAMAAERDPLYAEVADQVLDTDVLSPDEAADAVVAAVRG
jgi:shikimate kinase